MSMWSLMAAPLIYSGDMTRLDAFTLNVLCNTEVIDVNQDTLGKQGRIIRETLTLHPLLLETASGALQSEQTPRKSPLEGELSGRAVRDLWRKDAGTGQPVQSTVGRHGIMMVRLTGR
jgi:alpha-galactosidase